MSEGKKDQPAPELAESENSLVEASIQAHDDNLLEEALEESFPASDPVSANRFD